MFLYVHIRAAASVLLLLEKLRITYACTMAFIGFHRHFEESMDDYFQGGDEGRSVEGINRN